MDERERKRGELQKVVKMCGREGGTPSHFLLADREKLSSIVTSLAIVGSSSFRTRVDLTTGGVSVVRGHT